MDDKTERGNLVEKYGNQSILTGIDSSQNQAVLFLL